MAKSGRFRFDGGAATYWGTALLATLITVFTLGICYPFALVLRERWKAKHTYIDGRQLVFDGSAWALFGKWLKWVLFTVLTLGIYSFWVRPRLTQWVTENTDFAPMPSAAGHASSAASDPVERKSNAANHGNVRCARVGRGTRRGSAGHGPACIRRCR
jgi:hypothetical protein